MGKGGQGKRGQITLTLLIPGVPLKDQGYPNGIPIEIINFPGAS